MELRRKVMGLDGPLTFPNLYNAMIEGVEPEYTYDQGRKTEREAELQRRRDYQTKRKAATERERARR